MKPIEAVEAFFKAFNAHSNEALRSTLHYPHVLIAASGKTLVADSPGAFSMDFDFFADVEGWHHSSVNSMEEIQRSADKVHVQVAFTRHREDGSVIAEGAGLWIVTLREGNWGVQVRSLYGG